MNKLWDGKWQFHQPLLLLGSQDVQAAISWVREEGHFCDIHWSLDDGVILHCPLQVPCLLVQGMETSIQGRDKQKALWPDGLDLWTEFPQKDCKLQQEPESRPQLETLDWSRHSL